MAKPASTFRVLHPGRINPAWFVPISLGLAAADYLTGQAAVPPVFAVPVTVAAWYSGAKVGIPLAIFLPVTRLLTSQQISSEITPIRFILGVLTLILLAVVVARLERHERAMQERIAALESLLPVCGWCKSIRRADGGWESLEHFMESSGTQVTHGICPDCSQKHWSD
jgi:hypothetical protein